MDMNQNETYITVPDDSSRITREAIPSPAQPEVVIPGPTDEVSGVPPSRRVLEKRHAKFYGTSLMWRGVRLLGLAFGIAAVWFVGAWVRHGRMPLGLAPERCTVSFGSIYPPVWLVGILCFIVIISFILMLLGVQDVNPRMKSEGSEKLRYY